MAVDRCTGHCCRAFHIPYTPEALRKAWRAWRDREPPVSYPQDIDLIYPMVRPVAFTTKGEPTPGEPGTVAAADGWWYRCVHQEPNGDCGIYEDRPQMCRSYPNGHPCRYEGCTWDAAKRGEAGHEVPVTITTKGASEV